MSEPPVIDSNAAETELRTKRRRARRMGVISWLAAALILTLGLVGTSPYWAPALVDLLPWTPPRQDDPVAQLQQRVDALETQIAALKSADATRFDALEKNQQNMPDATALSGDVKRLDQITRALETMLASNEERLAHLENHPAGPAADTAGRTLFLALNQLSAAAASSRPFTTELNAAQALAQNKPEIGEKLAALMQDAASGLPSTATLTSQFNDSVAPALLRQPGSVSSSESWTKQFWARLNGLVVIRRVDRDPASPSIDPIAAAVDTAQADLAKNDLAGAVKAVEALPATSREPAQDWLTAAHRRLNAEATLADATQRAATALGNDAKSSGQKAP